MKYVKATAYIEGEIVCQHHCPLFCLGFIRWLCKLLGATLNVSEVKDTRVKP